MTKATAVKVKPHAASVRIPSNGSFNSHIHSNQGVPDLLQMDIHMNHEITSARLAPAKLRKISWSPGTMTRPMIAPANMKRVVTGPDMKKTNAH